MQYNCDSAFSHFVIAFTFALSCKQVIYAGSLVHRKAWDRHTVADMKEKKIMSGVIIAFKRLSVPDVLRIKMEVDGILFVLLTAIKVLQFVKEFQL